MLEMGVKQGIVVLGDDAPLMVPMDTGLNVGGEARQTELCGEIIADVGRDVLGIVDKGSEKTHGAELHGATPLGLRLPERA
jgi:hypothetical protein